MNDITPGSAEELVRFAELQAQLRPLFENVFPDRRAPRTVVIIPSLSLDQDLIGKIAGVQHYEERLLCMLLLLRLPRTRVIYVTSTPVDPSIVSYFLHLLPGVPESHARSRLTMLACHDASPATITEKILERPRLLRRLKEAIGDPSLAHMTCFIVSPLERTLAVRLGIPIFGNDPAFSDLGSKSGSREIFREAGIDMADGMERLRDARDVGESLAELKRHAPGLRRAVVKLEQGTSGEGNAVFSYEGAPAGQPLSPWVHDQLPRRLTFEAPNECWEDYESKFQAMGGVVESWVEGDDKRSPSAQGRVDPLGQVEIISTHDQILGGPNGQVFLGSRFPADAAYRLQIQEAGRRVGEVLRRRGGLGRYGVDFVSVPGRDGWRHHAIEINLRKGGTTHTFRVLQFLTDGAYDPQSGLYRLANGEPRFYRASDNLTNPDYRRFLPEDLLDVAVDHDLHFHRSTRQGVFFHLVGAVSQFGKLGVVCVGDSPESARSMYRSTVDILDREAVR
jgi:hypothetical protein